jgi:tRNA threonylcarbamoyladenosine biosynthesis protein TsaE
MRSRNAEETKKIGADFARKLSSPVLIGLSGDLGAGKTTFVQGMARGLGIDPRHYVNSPTFTMVNEYEGEKGKLIHVDLYRIEKPVEGETLALEEYLASGGLVVVEWIEKMPSLGLLADFQIRLTTVSEKEREIEITRQMP